MTNELEKVGTYTRPPTTVGATNLANRPSLSAGVMSLFHSSTERSVASKACSVPGTPAACRSPVVSHTIALPPTPPFADTAMPAYQVWYVEALCDCGVWLNLSPAIW